MNKLQRLIKSGKSTVRFAGETDFEQLLDYETGIDSDELFCRIWAGQVYILEVDGCFAGWLRYSFFADSIPCLNILYIFGPFRKRGFGRLLLNHWEQHLQDNHYKTVLALVSDEQSKAFCIHNGYGSAGKLDLETFSYSEITSKQLQKEQITA